MIRLSLPFLVVFVVAQSVAQSNAPSVAPLPDVGLPPRSVVVTAKPLANITTRAVLGEGRAATLWNVSVCNNVAASVSIARTRLLAGFPFSDLPNDFAMDLIGRQTSADFQSVIGANGDTLLGMASTGLTAGGIVTKTNPASVAGVGLLGLQFVFRLIGSRAPNAKPYFSQLMPDVVGLEPKGCPRFYVFAAAMHSAPPVSQQVVTIP